MKTRPEIVALLLFVVLTAYAAAQHVFVIPVIQYMLVSAGAVVSIPGRIAITISQYGLGAFLLFICFTLLALSRIKPAKDAVQQARVLNLATLAVVLFVVMEGSLYVDLAKSASKVMQSGRQTSSLLK